MDAPLIWNVFYGPWNRKIEQHNIFDHNGFWDDLVKANKKCKGDTPEAKEAFEMSVRKALMYHYWAKTEWEVVITQWPYTLEETRFIKESKKVDVYSQVNMNWDRFFEYVWNNRKLIK